VKTGLLRLPFIPQPDNRLNSDLKPGDLHMDKAKMTYFKDEDILHLAITDEMEVDSVEISPNITAELNEAGELIGIEIINASEFLRDSVLETTQARLLKLKAA